MLPKKTVFFIICFVSTFCETTDTLALSKREDFSNIYEKVVHVLELCFQNNLNPLITTNETRERIRQFSSKLQSGSIILINNHFKLNNLRNFNNELPAFLLTSYSKQYLETMLMVLNSSPWWNIKAFFILIGASNNSCVDASEIFNTTWKKKLLSAIYFCYYNNSNEVMLYTFNPFTHHAPNPWKIVASGEQDDPWTLYHQHFDDSTNICKNLMFDKTKYMNGYQLKVITNKPDDITKASKIQPYSLSFLLQRTPLPYKAILPAIFNGTNLTLSIYDGDLGWVANGKLSGSLVNLSKGDYDIYLQQRPLYIEYPYKTNPFLVTDIALLSTKTPFLKTEEKILAFFQFNLFILICFVGSISTLVLKATKKQDLVSALLNVLRIFLYTSILQPLRNGSVRIYFFGIFWLIVIINGTFQGKLSTFLTKPERHLIESINDVKKYQYHIYIPARLVQRYTDLLSPLDSKHIHPINITYCTYVTVNDTQAVCIGEGSTLVKAAENKYHLHVSSFIDKIGIVWMTSPNFSLIDKINIQLSRCIESGLMKLWYDQGYPNQRKKMLAVVAEETKAQYRPIQLYDILFAFKLLIIGLFCSSVVFILELNNR